MKRSVSIIIASLLIFTGCEKISDDNNKNENKTQLTYSNLVDSKTQDEIKKVLVENKISEEQADYFIKLVNDYNEKSKLKKFETSKKGFNTINKLQVPYDEGALGETWDYNKINYVDFNCRLTSFTLYKNFIKSQKEFSGDDLNLMFDLDTMENNPMSKFTKEETNEFKSLYSSISVKNTQDVEQLSKVILEEWDKRGIKFENNSNVSMINVFLHAPEDSYVFVGHTGISVKTDEGLLFVEKYGPSLPYQVSKFKDEVELKEYLMDRLDVNTADNGASKPIIMKNDKLF